MEKCEFCGIRLGKKYHSCPEAREYRAKGYRCLKCEGENKSAHGIECPNAHSVESHLEFVVSAVNSHYELLGALKELRQVVVNYNQGQKSANDHIGGSAIHEADKAIAKAEGK